MHADFTMREGDTGPVFDAVLTDDDGDLIDLTGAGVELSLAPAAGGTAIPLDNPVTIEPPATDGHVTWQAAATDTIPPGLYLAELVVTFGDGSVLTFPNEDALEVAITRRVGDLETGDLLELVPELGARRADFLLRLATRAVTAFLEPVAIPDPVPAAIELVILRHALALNRAVPSSAGAIVSESLGAYTYRLARPTALDEALELSDALKAELEPWAAAGRRKVYDVAVGVVATDWSDNWWQLNQDNPLEQ